MKKMISWVEIPAADFNRAIDFYSKVFELKLDALDYGKEKMACLPNNEGAICFAPDFKPSKDGALVSLNAGNELDAVLSRIESAGGKVLKPKTKIEAEGRGYFALFVDSEGNRLGLYGNK